MNRWDRDHIVLCEVVFMNRNILMVLGGCVVTLQVAVTFYVALIWLQPASSPTDPRIERRLRHSTAARPITSRYRT